MRSSTALLIGFATLAVGIGIGVYHDALLPDPAKGKDLRELSANYRFINPLLACSSDRDLAGDDVTALESDLSVAVKRHEDAADITDAAIYFKDLNDGPWVGVNSAETFSPGSLLKVPLAMSVYHIAEQDPSFLAKKLEYTGTETDNPQHFPSAPYAKGEHSVSDLVVQMLVQSDNDAANVLANAVGADLFQDTYRKLGLPQPPTSGADYLLTTNQYGYFFRVLYDGTFVSNQDSEHILELLSTSPFTKGLVAGVPQGIAVAHKFGEREFEDSTTVQLHDCGIVYAPQHPYLLCIMTRGADFDRMAAAIADFSRITYAHTTGQK